MTHILRRRSVRATVALSALLVLGLTVHAHLALGAASDCIGKPYGYPGCPTRPSTSAGSASSSGYCGNAIREDGEECDKGRFNGKTECSADCHVLFCGDGIVTTDIGEECEPEVQEFYIDDGKGNITTEMRFTGKQCGWYCRPPSCSANGTCSGGCRFENLDACPAEESSSSAQAASASSSSAAVSAASSEAPAAVCGDGAVQTGEECDDGNRVDTDACTNVCHLPRCGDGIAQKGEECDDGLKNSDIASNACRSNCTVSHCGDGVVDRGEQCDVGARNSDTQPNGCRTSCRAPACGDGVVDKGEQCDAGTENSDMVANACRTTCRLPVCGDGVIDGIEACDDGNRDDSDTCTNSCKKPGCGDGILQKGEECDWGTKNSDTQADTCRTTCKAPVCGDGVVDKGETCDGSRNCGADCRLAQEGQMPPAAVTSASSASSAKSDAAVHEAASPRNGAITIAAVIGTLGGLLVLSSLLLRKQIVAIFSPKGAKSIDDIPLDQIEMPWHKW